MAQNFNELADLHRGAYKLADCRNRIPSDENYAICNGDVLITRQEA